MAFFKFRKGADEPAALASAPESVEAMRQRAKHRLIGSAVLVLAGVIGFPLLFDNQPRPIAVDIPIEIPDKAKVKPLTIAPQAVPADSSTSSAGAFESAPAPKPAAPASAASAAAARVAGGSVTSAPAASVAAPPSAPAAPRATTPAPAASKQVAAAPEVARADAAKALALLEGKEVLIESKPAAGSSAAASAAAPSGARFIVQVGAYADVLKAREARQKLEQAGLKTYTQVINGTEGKRIRVRIGPFENKTEADKAAEKVRKLDLPAAILEL